MPKYAKFARIYDLIYSFKNYQAEADRLHAIVSTYKRSPGNTLLDVACGTGAHIAFLRRQYAVEGLDLSRGMLKIARQRFPGIAFHQGDMLDFDLGRKFDVATCLFSAIGYVKTAPGLRKAVANMARHLAPGGLLIVEPWLSPDDWKAGVLHGLFIDQPDIKIARMNVSQTRNGISVIKFHCLVGTPAGIEYFIEEHEMGLFSSAEYIGAFSSAGLEVFHDAQGLMGRGLYIGRPKES